MLLQIKLQKKTFTGTLFIDCLHQHVYVSHDLLKNLIECTHSRKIHTFNLDYCLCKSISHCHIDNSLPFRSTVILTINKTTLNNHFNYNNNVLVLKCPKLTTKYLVFDEDPEHIRNGITLTQISIFLTKSNVNILY